MSRYALLVFNEAMAPRGTKWQSLDAKLLEAFESKIKRILNCPHEDYDKFKIDIAFSLTSKTAKEKIERFFSRKYEEEDLVLFYYLGHALKDEERPIAFLFKDSFEKKSKDKSIYSPDIKINKTLSIADLEAQIKNTSAKKIILILDCCYSGVAAEEIKLTVAGKSIFIMSSVTDANVAVVHTQGDIGSGAFSLGFLDGIDSGQAAKELTGRITIGDAFSYARKWVIEKYPFQQPKTYGDIALADEPIYYETDSFIEGRLQHLSPISVYNKIGKLLELIGETAQKNMGEYYSMIMKKKPDELHVKLRNKDGKIETRILSFQTFIKHVKKCKEFGFIKGTSTFDLTDRARDMFKDNCRRYNFYLRKGLLNYLNLYGITLGQIEDKIIDLIKAGRSSAAKPLWEAFIIEKRRIGFYDFSYVIKLLAFIRVLRYTNRRYYLPSRGGRTEA
jgi:hypothetical protein